MSNPSSQPTSVRVTAPNVQYSESEIVSQYQYYTTSVTRDAATNTVSVQPGTQTFTFKTDTSVPKLGVMLVGWGGNNGSTVTASILANRNKLTWRTKEGEQQPNYFGSITQASTVNLGVDSASGADVFVPLKSMLPMVEPNDIVLGGWDINGANLFEAMQRAGVLDWDLQRQLEKEMSAMKPLPSIYYPDFIAANQEERADNLIAGDDKGEHLEKIRSDIRSFKEERGVDKVVVCWTANTERFAELIPGVNDTADNLLRAIKESHEEVSPSTVFAVACILEGVVFINGSPQNTFVPGCIELAEREKAYIAGDDFKSGQTKLKSVLVDFLVNAGIKPLAISSFNHLGNNDGRNLSSQKQFRSKEISKSNVVDDMVDASRGVLYAEGEHPDHTVVIKYVPAVGDSKRALDEYVSEIFMGGRSVISIYNVCEDSLLASPLIIDLVVMAELMTRVTYKQEGDADFHSFHSVLSILSYLLKAPLAKPGAPVVNSLVRQRAGIENVFRAFIGLQPNGDLHLQHKVWNSNAKQQQLAQAEE